jgi:hypothetical protein
MAIAQCSTLEMIMTQVVSPAPRWAPPNTSCVASARV